MKSQSFEQLIVWQKAHSYVLAIYKITKQYPKEELFCLVNQMRRAAASITANIAEGYAKISSKDKLRFYNISQGSLEETRNFIILSKDLGYITLQDKEQLGIQAAEISRLLNAYCIALLKNVSPPTTSLPLATINHSNY